MSPMLLAAVIIGQAALAGGILILSRVIQCLQVDARRPGAIIDQPERRSSMIRPPELELIERLVADAIASDSSAVRQLGPLLTHLGHEAPGGRVDVPPPERDRRRWLVGLLPELERAWGISPPS